jgi:serine/threonine-protein kinase RsbW
MRPGSCHNAPANVLARQSAAAAHVDVHSPSERTLSMNPPAELHCTLTGTVAELPAFFERMEDWALDHDVPLPLASSFGLMLDEWLTNVATHGYQGQGGPVTIHLSFDAPATLNAIVRDEGPAFDPTALVAADVEASLEDRHIGGLGVHFVKKLANRFAYRRDGSCNEISLSRTLGLPQASPGGL